MTLTIDTLEINPQEDRNNLWFNGPAEFLVYYVADVLRKDPYWGPIFGVTEGDPRGFIEDYKRQDFPISALPALRVYNETYDKQFESWFVEGDLILDLIFPASIRREDLQHIPDTMAAAMLQQFRRKQAMFNKIDEHVPGLNELGKRFSVDKSLGFVWGDDAVPLTQMKVNFKIDLRIWDNYLEQTDRTKNSPYSPVLGNLRRIVSTIQALRDGSSAPEVTVPVDQSTVETDLEV